MSSMDDDSIRIIPKTRMLKKSGHGIDNVLKNHGFSQVSFNRPEGCRVPGLNSFSLFQVSCVFFRCRQVSDSARIIFFLHVLGEDPENTPSLRSHENTHQLPCALFNSVKLSRDRSLLPVKLSGDRHKFSQK